MPPMLQTKGLTSGYGQSMVVHDLSIEVEPGELVGLVGPNGSGKSTFLKSIVGLTKIFEGQVMFNGKDITRLKANLIIREGIGYVPQVSNVFSRLTVRENFEMGAITLHGSASKDAVEKSLHFFPRLKERENQKVGTLSGGERQMLAISRALIPDPKLLLIDEPAASLSPKIAAEVFTRLEELHRQGKTVVIVEQNVKRALSISDRGYVLISGRKAVEGKASDILAMDIGKIFLGQLDSAEPV